MVHLVPELAADLVRRMVAFASMAFGIVGIIASALCKDVDSKMNNKVFPRPQTNLCPTKIYNRLKSTWRTPKWHLETLIIKYTIDSPQSRWTFIIKFLDSTSFQASAMYRVHEALHYHENK